MRVLVDCRREVLVRRKHAAGREQCGGREGVEGRTHEYIMPWVLAMPRRRAGVLRPSMRTVVDDGQPLRCAARFLLPVHASPNFSILVCHNTLIIIVSYAFSTLRLAGTLPHARPRLASDGFPTVVYGSRSEF